MTAYNKKYIYAAYKGEQLLCDGTADEICAKLGIKYNTFQFYRSNWYKKHRYENSNKRIVILRIDKEDKIYND